MFRPFSEFLETLPDPCEEEHGINVGTVPGLFSQRPWLTLIEKGTIEPFLHAH